MADAAALWSFILQALADDKPVALAIVAATHGSVPARAGSKMAITLDAAHGTLGGGVIEERMLRQARDILRQHEQTPWIQTFGHEMHGNDTVAGLWCGGAQTVLIYPCKPQDAVVFQKIRRARHDRCPVAFRLERDRFAVEVQSPGPVLPEWQDGECWGYSETLEPPKRAFIIGAGHVGQSLARLLNGLSFDVHLLDSRDSAVAPIDADATPRQIVDYQTIERFVPEGDDVFVFVMTHRHIEDQKVIGQLAGKSYAYLGLLGSRGKVARIKSALADQVDAEHLEKLRAPIGLAISSRTPHEIAISIAAEVVALVNGSDDLIGQCGSRKA